MSLLQTTLTSLLTVIGDTGGCDGRVQPAGAAFSGLATTEQHLYLQNLSTTEKRWKNDRLKSVKWVKIVSIKSLCRILRNMEDILKYNKHYRRF